MDHSVPVKVGRVTVGPLYTDERRVRPFVYVVSTYPTGPRRLFSAPTTVDVHDFYDTARAASHRMATITQLRSARKGGRKR